MGNISKNLAFILGLATIAFGGYYLFTQYVASDTDFSTNEQNMQNMLNETRAFIEYETILNQMNLDLSILEDERFISLRSYSTPIIEQNISRPDPFASVNQPLLPISEDNN